MYIYIYIYRYRLCMIWRRCRGDGRPRGLLERGEEETYTNTNTNCNKANNIDKTFAQQTSAR